MKHSTQAMLNILRVPNQHETYMSRVKDVVRKAAALFVFAMFVACAASPAMAAGLMKITEIQGRGGASSGDMTAKSPDRTIYFGNYWQNPAEDYNPTGTWGDPEDFDAAHWKKEGILWRVLANNTDPGDGSTGVLLLSDQGLYADKFNPRGSNDNKWVSSDIRETLTGLDKQEASTGKAYDQLKEQSFAHDAFNPKEYAAIANTTHIAGGTYAGSDDQSIDKLFLLSKEEATSTDYGFSAGIRDKDNKRKASPTAFAYSVKMYGNTSGAYVYSGAAWW